MSDKQHIDDCMDSPPNYCTLRDQLAMAALTGLVAGITDMDGMGIITNRPNDCAEIAYVYADAMLKAREEQP